MAISTVKTPGVYIDEVSTLPPSVAPVATAIPAFIGYTEIAPKVNGSTWTYPNGAAAPAFRITSLPEYASIFGGPDGEAPTITVADALVSSKVVRTITTSLSSSAPTYKLYYSLQLYFANGGGPCYIVSVGTYSDAIGVGSGTNKGFEQGLAVIAKEDEPTLLVFPDAVGLSSLANFGAVAAASLDQCNKLQDRFTILDEYTDSVDLTTDIPNYRGALPSSNLKYGASYVPYLKTIFNFGIDEAGTTVTYTGGLDPNMSTQTLDVLKTSRPDVYNAVYAELNKRSVTLPPSGAMAGIYASVDRDRGVWKAPANVSINSISGPTILITAAQQEDLNVDATSGKSINAIRSFTGKGTLVWGSRTLAGNDNEWRYVPVRRLFIFAEESIKKATEFVVFEPNDANTWLRVKTLISNFLTNLWRDGALAGATPKDAFFVKCALGETMSAQDILEGKLIIQVGMAAVRPAEFIILQFMHKLQES